MDDGPRELYRHYNADGRLLYVGVTRCAVVRTDDHARLSRWFDQVSTIKIERFDTLWEALKAESSAIVDESPLYNKAVSVGIAFSGRPLDSERHKTLTATQPWKAAGMSRRTWYRRQAEKRK